MKRIKINTLQKCHSVFNSVLYTEVFKINRFIQIPQWLSSSYMNKSASSINHSATAKAFFSASYSKHDTDCFSLIFLGVYTVCFQNSNFDFFLKKIMVTWWCKILGYDFGSLGKSSTAVLLMEPQRWDPSLLLWSLLGDFNEECFLLFQVRSLFMQLSFRVVLRGITWSGSGSLLKEYNTFY